MTLLRQVRGADWFCARTLFWTENNQRITSVDYTMSGNATSGSPCVASAPLPYFCATLPCHSVLGFSAFVPRDAYGLGLTFSTFSDYLTPHTPNQGGFACSGLGILQTDGFKS